MSARVKVNDGQEKEGRIEAAAKEARKAAGAKKTEQAVADGGVAREEAVETETAEGAGMGETADSAEPMESPQQKIDQLNDQFLRLTADFDNYRKRMLRDKEDWSRYASQSIVGKLIPVVDNLDAAALAVEGAGQEAKGVAEGFLMIHKQLAEILGQEGLKEIPALGEAFDPNVHEAVMTVERGEGQEDNEVVMVLRKGYMFKDKVLRPSMVQVAKD